MERKGVTTSKVHLFDESVILLGLLLIPCWSHIDYFNLKIISEASQESDCLPDGKLCEMSCPGGQKMKPMEAACGIQMFHSRAMLYLCSRLKLYHCFQCQLPADELLTRTRGGTTTGSLSPL